MNETPPEMPECPERRIRVLSYNIHQCIGLDRRRSVERIARIIDELAPDIVGLQEVDNQFGGSHTGVQLEYLARIHGMELVGGPTLMREEGDYGNGLLTRCPIRQVRRLDLSFPGREPRGVIDAEIETEGGLLRIIVTHLGLQPAERRFQARQLVRLLHCSSLDPVVLVGDLNEWLPWGRPARWLHREFGRAPARRTFPSWLPLFPLDRVLVRPGDALVDIQAVNSPRTRQASDHLPLLATIALDQAGSDEG